MKKNLTIKNVADVLGSSTRTVYRLIGDGEITAFHVRGSLKITEESLDAYRDRQILKYADDNGIVCQVVTGRDSTL